MDSLELSQQAALAEGEDSGELRRRLTEALQERIRRRERRSRDAVQSLYRHQGLDREEAATELLDTDLFTAEGWQLFGLSRTQLAISGALTGKHLAARSRPEAPSGRGAPFPREKPRRRE